MRYSRLLLCWALVLWALPVIAAPSFRADTDTQFFVAAPMQVARMNHHIVADASDRVTLFAGHGVGFNSLDTAEILEPDGEDFMLRSMLYKHDDPAFVRLANGSYLIMGGSRDWGIPNYSHTQLYNPATQVYTAGGALVRFRAAAGSALLNNGNVLVVGAWWTHNDAHTYGELYQTGTNTFSATGAFSVRRSHPVVLPLADGRAVVFGGITETGGQVDMPVEVYNPVTGGISVHQTLMFPEEPGWNVMKSKRINETHQLSDTLYLFYAWKRVDGVNHYRLFTFDAETLAFEWVETEELPASTMMGFNDQPTLSQNKQAAHILVTHAEGEHAGKVALLSVDLASGEVYLSDNKWDLEYGLYGAASIGLQDNRILVTGGTSDGSNFNPVNNSFYITPVLIGSGPVDPEPEKARYRSMPAWLYVIEK